ADHDGLGHFNAGRDHQQPPKNSIETTVAATERAIAKHPRTTRPMPKARNQPQLWTISAGIRTSRLWTSIIACSLPLAVDCRPILPRLRTSPASAGKDDILSAAGDCCARGIFNPDYGADGSPAEVLWRRA